MTTKEIIEKITAWVNESICSKIKLKLPDDDMNDARYEVKFVNPAAFPLFVPAKDRMPPNVEAPIPSIAVQLLEGSDNIKNGIRTLKIRLCLSTWNPGTHPGEKQIPVENVAALGGYSYQPGDTESEKYNRTGEGWKDLYNFQDIALSQLEGEELFADIRMDMNEPITYGPFTEDGVIWDYYPYWSGWIAFTVICGVPYKKSEAVRDLLN
ncbi:MAG: hypothetical protein HDR21_13870 [Lachnospiraceae bacterium]|nr:hypothetical protein [Lachnospiraceae bacterium]